MFQNGFQSCNMFYDDESQSEQDNIHYLTSDNVEKSLMERGSKTAKN